MNIIDTVMSTIEKGRATFHGASFSFRRGDDFVYVALALHKVNVNGLPLDLTNQEFEAVLDFILDNKYIRIDVWN